MVCFDKLVKIDAQEFCDDTEMVAERKAISHTDHEMFVFRVLHSFSSVYNIYIYIAARLYSPIQSTAARS